MSKYRQFTLTVFLNEDQYAAAIEELALWFTITAYPFTIEYLLSVMTAHGLRDLMKTHSEVSIIESQMESEGIA
ncbi:MAG: hypothetical protein WCP31_02530 [Chloroflexales bacterium]